MKKIWLLFLLLSVLCLGCETLNKPGVLNGLADIADDNNRRLEEQRRYYYEQQRQQSQQTPQYRTHCWTDANGDTICDTKAR